MTTDCSIHENSKLKPGENMLCTEIVHSEQFLYTTCSAKRRASDKDLPVSPSRPCPYSKLDLCNNRAVH